MITSYDGHSGIVYIVVDNLYKIAKTVEFDRETVLELDASGHLVGIEMIRPRKSILKRIAKKYGRWELARVNLERLTGSLKP